ncbi:MAG TPA: phosphatidylserine decarboxylase [Hanamia sp.]|nr:phosphatidylserine decarboxylase [Hanamia sp.]
MSANQKSVEDLRSLLQSRPDLSKSLNTALKNASLPGIGTLTQFYNFLNKILVHIPTERELMPSVREFYFIIGSDPGGLLKKDSDFNKWVQQFVVSRGNFMDTTESAQNLDTFINNPDYNIDDYTKGPGGWLTYNQFLARQVKPGRRPVAGLCDDGIIVSPADSEFCGQWPINDGSTITAKGTTYSIAELISGSAYADKFKDGIFTHSFLSITDYHRFHLPVGGIVREVKKIPASTWINEAKKADGSVENVDDVGFQFTHTRGYVIIESAIGFVAIIPVGMGHISSVTFTAEEGARLVKGEEFGFFAFGGSDIIMLFQKSKIKFNAKEKVHYKQGEQIAVAVKA